MTHAVPRRHSRSAAHFGKVTDFVSGLRIPDDDESPWLIILSGRRPPCRFENFIDHLIGNRIGLVSPDAFAVDDDINYIFHPTTSDALVLFNPQH